MRFEDKVEILRIKKHKGRETPEFLADVKSLTEGEAYEYLMGEVEFAGAKIDLSLRPMIPRPETELIVENALKVLRENSSMDDNVYAGLDYCFNEILDNVLNHSRENEGWVSAQYFESINSIRLIICDSGIGIHQSLSLRHDLPVAPGPIAPIHSAH